jgi:hypothetical protein
VFSPVGLAPVGYSLDRDDPDAVADGVEDAVVTETNTVGVVSASELDATMGPRFGAEAMDDYDGALSVLECR